MLADRDDEEVLEDVALSSGEVWVVTDSAEGGHEVIFVDDDILVWVAEAEVIGTLPCAL